MLGRYAPPQTPGPSPFVALLVKLPVVPVGGDQVVVVGIKKMLNDEGFLGGVQLLHGRSRQFQVRISGHPSRIILRLQEQRGHQVYGLMETRVSLQEQDQKDWYFHPILTFGALGPPIPPCTIAANPPVSPSSLVKFWLHLITFASRPQRGIVNA